MVRRCLLSPTSVIGFDVLDELGAAPTTIAIAREGYRRTGEMLAPLLALLSLENGIRGHIVDDLLPPETMIGALPGWALDMFTREGRKALGLLLQNDAGIRTWARTTIGPTGRIEILAQALFRVESGLCLHRTDGATSKWLRHLMEIECMGMPLDEASQALRVLSAAIPALNRARNEVMGGHPTHPWRNAARRKRPQESVNPAGRG